MFDDRVAQGVPQVDSAPGPGDSQMTKLIGNAIIVIAGSIILAAEITAVAVLFAGAFVIVMGRRAKGLFIPASA